MTSREIRRFARRFTVRASIVADGCRDYAVEIVAGPRTEMLCDWRGRVSYFRNLDEARRCLRACGVREIVFRHRVAHDEACQGPSLTGGGFAEMSIHHAA